MTSKTGTPAGVAPDPWEQTGSLLALRECTESAARVRGAVARRAGLSESEVGALQHLMSEPLGPAELSRRLRVSTAAGTGIVDRLAGHGHVTRQAHPDDRRRTQVLVTASARAEVFGLMFPMLSALRELDASFDADERAVVERYLRGAAAAFREITDPPESPESEPRAVTPSATRPAQPR